MNRFFYLIPAALFFYGLIFGLIRQKMAVTFRDPARFASFDGSAAVIMGLILINLAYLVYRFLRWGENYSRKEFPSDIGMKISTGLMLGLIIIFNIVVN